MGLIAMNSNQEFVMIKEVPEHYQYDEAIRSLRTNLLFSGSNIKAVMFTSAMPDEGKSSVSFSLAREMARIGKRTVLVDADIRKSVMRSRYLMSFVPKGLSQYLSGQCRLDQIVYKTEANNLSVIFAGPYSPNPLELLEEDLFGQMFETLRQEYDYIVVDTPPMAGMSDGSVVAKHCDGVVLVVESGAISYHLEQKVKTTLERTGGRILGVVLNKVDLRNQRYYGKYGKYGKYAKYDYGYGYGPKKERRKRRKKTEKAAVDETGFEKVNL